MLLAYLKFCDFCDCIGFIYDDIGEKYYISHALLSDGRWICKPCFHSNTHSSSEFMTYSFEWIYPDELELNELYND